MSNKFKELFYSVIEKGILTEENPTILEISLNFRFNEWLKRKRGWNGNSDTWEPLVNEVNFAEFMKNTPLYYTDNLEGLIQIYEIRSQQDWFLYSQERKERGASSGIEDEYYCRLRSLQRTMRNNEQWFLEKYPNGRNKGFNPEIKYPFFADERKKFRKWLLAEITKVEGLINNVKPPQAENKTPTAPAKALFCNLINEAGIIKRLSNEIPETYCKRICEKFNLSYSDRVRQNFNGNKSKKHYKEVIELILPFIDVTIKEKVQKILDSKYQAKQKLYA